MCGTANLNECLCCGGVYVDCSNSNNSVILFTEHFTADPIKQPPKRELEHSRHSSVPFPCLMICILYDDYTVRFI